MHLNIPCGCIACIAWNALWLQCFHVDSWRVSSAMTEDALVEATMSRSSAELAPVDRVDQHRSRCSGISLNVDAHHDFVVVAVSFWSSCCAPSLLLFEDPPDWVACSLPQPTNIVAACCAPAVTRSHAATPPRLHETNTNTADPPATSPDREKEKGGASHLPESVNFLL